MSAVPPCESEPLAEAVIYARPMKTVLDVTSGNGGRALRTASRWWREERRVEHTTSHRQSVAVYQLSWRQERSTGNLFPTKTQSPRCFVLESWVQIRLRNFYLATVFQLHALLITLQKNVDPQAEVPRRAVQILGHRHKVGIERHQCVAGTVVTTDAHSSEQRRQGCFRRRGSVRTWAPPRRQSQATRSYLLFAPN